MRKQTMIIFSSDRIERTKQENKRIHDDTRVFLDALQVPYNVGTGVYKGEGEKCFVVPTNMVNIELIKKHALEQLGQECALVQHGDGLSRLEFSNEESQVIGRIKEISIDEASDSEAYTVINGRYYRAL